MQKLFQYNWQVRQDWFDWCRSVPEEELLKKRTGGVGAILPTLFHIVDVEYNWLCELDGRTDFFNDSYEGYATLQKVEALSERLHESVQAFVSSWSDELESKILQTTDSNGEAETFLYGEVMRHVIAHEIHHIGQLSVWSRELDQKPVTANLIRRGLFK
ncbi:DinB family protein [Paenibacillus pasadenensis]|uniref:DinB family protein n=1 Tax=Paenibacillus pasadenensis TaxID=217090 RepID=UPI0020405692|nr:DinB family protein [Paenibacillus pasadenensis]MCM3749917.1 DinB family protein [Paenibacillus pasadenensis]